MRVKIFNYARLAYRENTQLIVLNSNVRGEMRLEFEEVFFSGFLSPKYPLRKWKGWGPYK